ncbi:hypothetical protein SAMN02745962_03137 [Pseudomonas sp. LAIL14HWK12:I11]|nr:hypothetical protein SAMN02745962_03137 [Pseudomonas sp. LAIL14HWK12:I11]SMR77959.1 hypothetical protein SAMN05661028_02990 [Pseudomonas sp. LAIL14HWK12:I10]SOD04242.1 hypothetical protein SAMN05660296_02845 [Pseudomonas sp. LAIL14HWK12:I8]
MVKNGVILFLDWWLTCDGWSIFVMLHYPIIGRYCCCFFRKSKL